MPLWGVTTRTLARRVLRVPSSRLVTKMSYTYKYAKATLLRSSNVPACVELRPACASVFQYGHDLRRYPRPGMTVDACIVAEPQKSQSAQVLLIQRQKPPCQGMWALPGGFVDENEPLDKAAARELQEETHLDPKDLLFFQVGAFGDPGRDPRGWAVSAAYAALIPTAEAVKGGDDAAEAQWFDVTEVPAMAFDHKLIVRTAFEKLLEQKEARGKDTLRQQLQQGIKHLAGPWRPPKE